MPLVGEYVACSDAVGARWGGGGYATLGRAVGAGASAFGAGFGVIFGGMGDSIIEVKGLKCPAAMSLW
jgi:hypothetical protein